MFGLHSLPTDTFDVIESHLGDLRAWRSVVGRTWSARTQALQARWMLTTISPAPPRARCTAANCSHYCITEIMWRHHRIPWVPYCIVHASGDLLEGFEVFCLGAVVVVPD